MKQQLIDPISAFNTTTNRIGLVMRSIYEWRAPRISIEFPTLSSASDLTRKTLQVYWYTGQLITAVKKFLIILKF